MARVVMACALKHHTRRGERDPERWQLASQLVTHALIRDAGFTLPPDAEAWEEVSVEQAYEPSARARGRRLRGRRRRIVRCRRGRRFGPTANPRPTAMTRTAVIRPIPPATRTVRTTTATASPTARTETTRTGTARARRATTKATRVRPMPRPATILPAPGRSWTPTPAPARRRRLRRGTGGHHRRGAGLGRGHAPGAQHRPHRGECAGPGRGDDSGRPRPARWTGERCCAAT